LYQYGFSALSNFAGSYSSDRKRNHTAHSLGAAHIQPMNGNGGGASSNSTTVIGPTSAATLTMTVPSINPVTISNAAAALSNLSHHQQLMSNGTKGNHIGSGHYNHGHPLGALNSHLRNINQAIPMSPSLSASSSSTVTHNAGGLGNSEAVGLSGGLLSLTSDAGSKPGTEESRRRAITEPNRFWAINAQQMALQQRPKGHTKQVSKGMCYAF
jgi:hypothetical protein